MTREEALAKIPAKYHATADALHAATGIDWQRLWSLLARVVPELIDIFLNQPMPMHKAGAAGCDAELENTLFMALLSAEDGVLQSARQLCAVQCALHAAGCDQVSLKQGKTP